MSLLRNLATSLITAEDERLITTVPKAKELRSFVERAITLARRASNLENDTDGVKALHLRRQAAGFFHAGNRQQTLARSHYWTNKKAGGKVPERTAGVAAVKRLFDDLGERYKDRNGGYTRIIRLGWREGDNAEMAIIELVDNPREVSAAREQSERKAKEAAKRKKPTKKESDE